MDIIELAEWLGYRPRKEGKYYKIKCIIPGHTDKEPSLYLDKKRNTFLCYGCNESGGFLEFYALATGTTKDQAKTDLKTQNISIDNTGQGITPQTIKEKPERAEYSHIYEVFIKHLRAIKPEQRAIDYLHNERLLTDETIERFNLCILPPGDTAEYKETRELLLKTFTTEELIQAGLLDHNNRIAFCLHRVIIPIRKEGELIALQGRYFDKVGDTKPPTRIGKYKNTLGGKYKGIFLNIDILKIYEDGDKVILCEGVFDTMLCYQEQRRKLRADITESEPAVIGVISATAWTEENIKSLAKYDLTIALHRDKAKNGQETKQSIENRNKIIEIYKKASKREAVVLRLPLGVDICEYYKARRPK